MYDQPQQSDLGYVDGFGKWTVSQKIGTPATLSDYVSHNFRIMGSLFGETFGVFILFWSVIYVKMKSSTKSFSKEAFIACLILISFLLAFSLILNILLPFKDVLGSFTYVSFLTFELLFGIILPCYFIHTTPSLKYFVHKLCFKNKVDII